MSKKVLNFFLDCLFPTYCLNCKKFLSSKKKSFLCKDCFEKIEIESKTYCPSCLKESNQNCPCENRSSIDIFGFATSYQDPLIKNLVYKYKYRFIKKMDLNLANIIIAYLKKSSLIKQIDSKWILIPIPLHKSRENWRGFNQSQRITNIIGSKLNLTTYKNLVRIKKTKTQAKALNQKDRKENLSRSFKVNFPQEIENKKIILIDDIRSSGATLEEAAKSLKLAKANKIIAVVIAK